eukprot:TRINITY_DN235_c0_g1_i2.p1 TRINITY_DN235_c0_g1~~TRINITY_DN235_c0_g1_i2.p1  ORF type:complete len:1141 (-),score=219.14 TRINITY_DN235_c0_g1_i2:536-3958(-)
MLRVLSRPTSLVPFSNPPTDTESRKGPSRAQAALFCGGCQSASWEGRVCTSIAAKPRSCRGGDLRFTQRWRNMSRNSGHFPEGGAMSSEISSGHDHMPSAAMRRHSLPDFASLERWRKSILVLNAARRFRYIGDISHRQQAQHARRRLKKGFQAAVVAQRLTALVAGKRGSSDKLEADDLAQLAQTSSIEYLNGLGGIDGLARAVGTDLDSGIHGSQEDLAERQKRFGSNKYTETPPTSFLSFVWEAFQDITLLVLVFCAILSLVVGVWTEGWQEGWYDGAGISLSVVIVVLVTAVSDYRQSLQFRQLNNEKKKIFIQVMRRGRRQKVSIYDLVVGDIVLLGVGDVVPADGVFVHGYSLKLDESSMTGESDVVSKDEQNPILLSGTKVQEGSAKMLVTGVGMSTEWGKLMASLSEGGEDPTPLQLRLSAVATLVGKLGLLVAVLVFTILMTRFLAFEVNFAHWTGEDTLKVVRYLAISTTIIVVAVPEGLPLAVTLTLAYAMQRMMADKALVRHLVACETMGSATTICSDKTGTLTSNCMTVVKSWVAGSLIPARVIRDKLPEEIFSILVEGIFNNTNGDVAEEPASPRNGGPELIGSPTETAVLSFGLEMGANFQDVRSRVRIVRVDPFNSKTKRMGTAVQVQGGGAERLRVHWKGAAEVLLRSCTRVVGEGGRISSLTDARRAELNGVVERMAESALRTLCFAYADVPVDTRLVDSEGNTAIPARDLVCLAIVGLQDPVRPEVPGAVALCHSAGIQVRMVTGDNLQTAKAIATQCGILNGGVAIEGPEFRTLDHDQLRALIPNLQVMARSSPSDKLKLVKELRAMGEVVAVTGDGTNDAPALNEADIGLAMGIAGTEVAKESADVVILDDNFASVVKVARWGRSVYENIQKFVQFQLTVNLVALTLNFISAVVTGEAPLTAVQLLWVNLIMDTLGALALATEPPSDSLMDKPPIGREGELINSVMWRNIVGQAMFQLTVLGLIQYHGQTYIDHHSSEGADGKLLSTVIFNTFVFCQVFNEINSREMEKINVFKNIHKNGIFIGVMVVTVAFQTVMVYYLGSFASTVPLTAPQFFFCVGVGALALPWAAVIKMVDVSDGSYAANSLKALQELGQMGQSDDADYTEIPGEADVEAGRRKP